MRGYYMAARKFDQREPDWGAYAKWRGLPQLTEVVSIENGSVLDPTRLDPQHWDSVAPSEEVNARWLCFTNLDALLACLRQLAAGEPHNLLCVFREPDTPPAAPPSEPAFVLLGFDLIEDRTGVSALTNCGSGFPLAFADADISAQGLIPDFSRARQVQADLRRNYPTEPHADCSLWAIFRAKGWP